MGFNLLDLLLPRETKFYDYMNQHMDFLVEGTTAFQDMVGQLDKLTPAELKTRLVAIKTCESEMDKVEATIIEELQLTFITPLDREDIHTLAIQVDRAMDIVNGVARKIEIYGITKVPNYVLRMADLNATMARLLREIMHLLQAKKEVREHCEKLHKMENDCDELFNQAMAELFRSDYDALSIIKYKELYEMLEDCSDTIDYVGKLIRGVRVKQG